jgi:hypothetical protein
MLSLTFTFDDDDDDDNDNNNNNNNNNNKSGLSSLSKMRWLDTLALVCWILAHDYLSLRLRPTHSCNR